MWSAKPLQMLALALLLFLQGAGMFAAPARALASTGGTAAAAWALAPVGAGPAVAPRRPDAERVASRLAADAPPSIGERRARAVAMTVFSLSAVIGAGFLLGYLIKRLL